MAGYFSDLTKGGLQRKKERAAAGQSGPKTAHQLVIADEAKALETGAYKLSADELEAMMAKTTAGLGATTQATLQAMGPMGGAAPGGGQQGKMMQDLQNLQKGIGEQVSGERMTTQQLEREIEAKQIADAKARITQAEQMRAGKVASFAKMLIGGTLGAASLA